MSPPCCHFSVVPKQHCSHGAFDLTPSVAALRQRLGLYRRSWINLGAAVVFALTGSPLKGRSLAERHDAANVLRWKAGIKCSMFNISPMGFISIYPQHSLISYHNHTVLKLPHIQALTKCLDSYWINVNKHDALIMSWQYLACKCIRDSGCPHQVLDHEVFCWMLFQYPFAYRKMAK